MQFYICGLANWLIETNSGISVRKFMYTRIAITIVLKTVRYYWVILAIGKCENSYAGIMVTKGRLGWTLAEGLRTIWLKFMKELPEINFCQTVQRPSGKGETFFWDQATFCNRNSCIRIFALTTQKINNVMFVLQQIASCPEFLNLSLWQRYNFVQKTNSCNNYLWLEHNIGACKSAGCKICGSNSLLHDYFSDSQEKQSSPSREVISASSHCSQVSVCNELKNSSQMYTAIVLITDAKGKFHRARALLDNASQINFITNRLCENCELTITGAGQCTTRPSGCNTFNIKSVNGNYTQNISCFVIPKITCKIPDSSFSKNMLNIPSDISLADPDFNISQEVDLLLGVEVFR